MFHSICFKIVHQLAIYGILRLDSFNFKLQSFLSFLHDKIAREKGFKVKYKNHIS